jgi:hypothetical protein
MKENQLTLACLAILSTLILSPLGVRATEDAPRADGKNSPASSTTQANLQREMVVEGPIAKVVTRKREIYVQGQDKKYEFYFRTNTQLLKDGQPVDFSVLTEGTKVRVSYVKVGKRTDPVKVEILQ